VLIGKPLAAIVIVLALGKSVRTALVVAIGLAQIGEFSFILASEGMRLEIFRQDGQTALVAAALISITLNPLLFRAIPAIERWLQRRPRLYAALQRRSEKRAMEASNMTMVRTAAELGRVHAVVVGYGPVGQTVARILREFKIEPVVIDMNVDTVNKLAGEGRAAVFGDASRPEVLKAAGIEKARYLLVTLPELAARIPVIIAARDLNPELRVLARARFVREGPMLEEIGVHVISYEESEAAVSLAAHMLRECGADNAHIAIEARKIRESLEPANVSPL
jgi:CPA2 family monovalent cation:H+ antiporter-2